MEAVEEAVTVTASKKIFVFLNLEQETVIYTGGAKPECLVFQLGAALRLGK
ncbi:MAG: hypothetical protein K2K56_15205 [Lachnospiraceae bacterium]|nr:hypothetical protein [Lachnospiraceae bacterium]